MPYAAGLWHWSPRALHLALQRFVLPERMFGRGMTILPYVTFAQVRAGRALAELFADLIKA